MIDLRAVFQSSHRELDRDRLHPLLLPQKGRYGLIDHEKVFCPDLKFGNDIFGLRGIDRQHGCLVVVRTDQYIAQVLPLDAYGELTGYFERFRVVQRRS